MSRFTAVLAATALVVLVSCSDGRTPAGPEISDAPTLSMSSGPWVERVAGGGRFERSATGLTEWVNLNVRKDDDGSVSGRLEYANDGLQGWRYQADAICLALNADGTAAAIITSVSLTQGPGAPNIGQRVAVWVHDRGPAFDRVRVLFVPSTLNCQQLIGALPIVTWSDVNHGNLTIARR